MSISFNDTPMLCMAATPIAWLQLSIADFDCSGSLPMLLLPNFSPPLTLLPILTVIPTPNIHIYPSPYPTIPHIKRFPSLSLPLPPPTSCSSSCSSSSSPPKPVLMQFDSLAPLVQEMCVDGTHPHPSSHRYDITPQSHERPGNI